MARKHFSEEDVDSLKKNPCVLKVSTKLVKFSSEFKQRLQLEMNNGLSQFNRQIAITSRQFLENEP